MDARARACFESFEAIQKARRAREYEALVRSSSGVNKENAPLYTGRLGSFEAIQKARRTPEYEALVKKFLENPFDLKEEDFPKHFAYKVLDLSARGLGRLPRILACAELATTKYNQDHGARFEFDSLLKVVYNGSIVAYITFLARDPELGCCTFQTEASPPVPPMSDPAHAKVIFVRMV